MSAKANLKSNFPIRYVTGGLERAPHRYYYFAANLTSEQSQQPCIADLNPAGRYVAKDLLEADGAPLLTKQVGPALKGAVTYLGGSAETSTYADI
jgi:hypothetical protein